MDHIDMKEHEAKVDAMLAKMKMFLMAPDHGDGDWPNISEAELEIAAELLGEVLNLKWGQDYSGDAPVRMRMWYRRQYQPVCDWAFLENAPRDNDSPEAEADRLVRNLRTATGALSSVSEVMNQVQMQLQMNHESQLRHKAAFEVHQVRYKAPADATEVHVREPGSLHLSKEAADRFAAEQEARGWKVQRRLLLTAVPGRRDRAHDGYAEYRQKVADRCEQVLDLWTLRQSMNFQLGGLNSRT